VAEFKLMVSFAREWAQRMAIQSTTAEEK